ncbi:MAG: GNAT family N-acetyltransferase [Acidobacteriota bacterium]
MTIKNDDMQFAVSDEARGSDAKEVLTTERLVLRHFTLDDAPFILELLNEPGWKRYIGDRGVNDLDGARNYIETGPVASYRKHGFGLWAVELKSDNSLGGMCGLIKRETLDDVDIGFALLARLEGYGFAREAAEATLAFAQVSLGLSRVVAITTIDNDRSGRLLKRIGMVDQGEVSFAPGGETLRLYAIDFPWRN